MRNKIVQCNLKTSTDRTYSNNSQTETKKNIGEEILGERPNTPNY